MVLAGMGIFIAAVPFHTWATTLHRRSGIGVSGVILAAMIPSCFLVLLRLVYTARIPELFVMMPFSFPDLIVGLSVLTMTVGNLYAYRQRHLHTMLVGAVIAQSGVALMGLLFVPSLGSGSHGLWSVNWSVLLFLVVTGGAVLLALSVLEVVERDARLESSEPVHKGLFRRSPWLAVALSLALMSLAGLPLSAGFMAKYNLFSELMVVSRGKLTVVLIIALINGLITLSYLLNSVLEMVRKVSFDAPDRRAPRRAVCAVIVTMLAVLVLVFGVWPGPLVRLARQAGHSIRYGGGKEVGRPGPVKLAPYAELYGSTEK
jgi:NADH-quinone oxidoreductase subunit N